MPATLVVEVRGDLATATALELIVTIETDGSDLSFVCRRACEGVAPNERIYCGVLRCMEEADGYSLNDEPNELRWFMSAYLSRSFEESVVVRGPNSLERLRAFLAEGSQSLRPLSLAFENEVQASQ